MRACDGDSADLGLALRHMFYDRTVDVRAIRNAYIAPYRTGTQDAPGDGADARGQAILQADHRAALILWAERAHLPSPHDPEACRSTSRRGDRPGP
jgi:hypothetical protein